MRQFTIGILGGMGPRATLFFEQRVLSRLSDNDQGLPRIVCINNGSIPDRTDFLTRRGPDPLPYLLNDANLLAQANPDIVCMPCNTAHASAILGRLQDKISLPIVDMPALAIRAARQAGCQSLLILSTKGTKDAQVYNEGSDDLGCVFPNLFDQHRLNDIIALIKSGAKPVRFLQDLHGIIKNYKVDGVVIACTELSMIPMSSSSVPIIDALECLADECIMRMNSYNRTKGARV